MKILVVLFAAAMVAIAPSAGEAVTAGPMLVGTVALGKFTSFDKPGRPMRLTTLPIVAGQALEGGEIKLNGCNGKALVIIGDDTKDQDWITSAHVVDVTTLTPALTLWHVLQIRKADNPVEAIAALDRPCGAQ